MTADSLRGSVWGLALGDAWGYPVEFDSYEKIMRDHPGGCGPDFPDRPALISDDTQMALATWWALDKADVDDDEDLTLKLIKSFQKWRVSPRNDRAPGNTCMSALGAMQGVDWRSATVLDSKGCGAVMRVPWIGMHPKVRPDRLPAVAQLQAAITHGHPTAVMGADLLAHLVVGLVDGSPSEMIIDTALNTLYDLDYDPILGDLWERGEADQSADLWAHRGISELERALEKAHAGILVLQADPWGVDPCTLAGDGWSADTCISTALLIVAALGDDPFVALRRAACTGGDSDSIAAVVGALLGAEYGDLWPDEWVANLEMHYFKRLRAVAT